MCQAPRVPGKGDVSLQTHSGNLTVLPILQGLLLNQVPLRERPPPFSEKGGILRFQVRIVQYLPKRRIITQLNSY